MPGYQQLSAVQTVIVSNSTYHSRTAVLKCCNLKLLLSAAWRVTCANTYLLAGSSTVAAEVLVSEAWSLLKDFTQQEARGLAQSFLDTSQKRQRLKTAVLVCISAI